MLLCWSSRTSTPIVAHDITKNCQLNQTNCGQGIALLSYHSFISEVKQQLGPLNSSWARISVLLHSWCHLYVLPSVFSGVQRTHQAEVNHAYKAPHYCVVMALPRRTDFSCEPQTPTKMILDGKPSRNSIAPTNMAAVKFIFRRTHRKHIP
jgi:hypothetical protein